MKKEYLIIVLILFSIVFLFQTLNMKNMAQAGPPSLCADPWNDLNCCGNHKLETGIGEQCDGRDSDCACNEKCNFMTCQCYDFISTLSGCDYFDNCSVPAGDTCNCAEDFCNMTKNPTDSCHNVLLSVCSDSSKICHRWFTCSL